jgi:hypothetical protein
MSEPKTPLPDNEPVNLRVRDADDAVLYYLASCLNLLAGGSTPKPLGLDPDTLTYGTVAHLVSWGHSEALRALREHPDVRDALARLDRHCYGQLSRRLIEEPDGTNRHQLFEVVRQQIAARHQRGHGPNEVDRLMFVVAVEILCPSEVVPFLTVTRIPPRASLNGQSFNLTEEGAVFLDILNSKPTGHWIRSEAFDAEPLLEGVRRDRIKLPPELRKIVEGRPGKGFRIKLA